MSNKKTELQLDQETLDAIQDVMFGTAAITPPEMEPNETSITVKDGQWCFHRQNHE